MDLDKIAQRYGAQVDDMGAVARKFGGSTDAPIDPTDGMSGWEKFAAGAGKALYDIGRGVGNVVTDIAPAAAELGFATRKDTDEANARDEALMNTGAGMAGNITGNVMALAPSVLIPGAAAVPGAMALGGVLGALQPVGEEDSRTQNAGVSALLSAAVPGGIAVAKGAKALVEPMTSAGRSRIVGRTLERFVDDPANLKVTGELVKGSKPTLAEATLDPGLATLQRSAVSADPAMASAITNRQLEQNAARVAALKAIGGDAGELDFHKAARSSTAEDLYSRAFSETPADTKWIKGEISKLKQRPAFAQALKEGQELAMNAGVKVSPKHPEHATEILHYTKMALDDQIEMANRAGNGNKQRALIDTRDKLVSLMESKDFSPSYREARDTFKQMSKPINRMETGQEIARQALPNLDDKLGNPSLTPAKLAETLKRMGNKGDLEKNLTPDDLQALEAIRQDLSRTNSVANLGKPTGSPTAQYLSSQNILRQMMGPLGMPNGFAESTILRTAMRPVDFMYSRAEPQLQNALAEALLDPQQAQNVLAMLYRQGKLPQLASQGARYAIPVASGMAGVTSANATQ